MTEQFVGELTGVDQQTGSKVRIRLSAEKGDVVAGGDGRGGDLQLTDHSNVSRIRLDAGGSEGFQPPSLAGGTDVIYIRGDGWVVAGGHGHPGKLDLRNAAGEEVASLGGGEAGDLYLRDESGEFTIALRAVEETIAGIWVGGHGQKGLLQLRNRRGRDSVTAGGGETGDVYLHDAGGHFTIALRAVEDDLAGLWMGGSGQNGHICLRDADGKDTMVFDGKEGDIILTNADCAEEFEIVAGADTTPGTVMVIEDDGRLGPSAAPYDRRVAGIVSGSDRTRPAIVLGRRPGEGDRTAIALAGRVECRVDAETGPVEVGDLLTSAAREGFAMKAADPARAFGAVIGKALGRLPAGTGTLPVLVALQ